MFGVARNQLAAYYRKGAIARRALEKLRWVSPLLAEDDREWIGRAADLEVSARRWTRHSPRCRRSAGWLCSSALSRTSPTTRSLSGSVVSEQTARAHVTQMLAPRRLPRIPAVRFTARPRGVAGGATAVAGAATVVVLAISAATSAPSAFAITSNPDGSVTITLSEISGVAGLTAKLASMGVAVRAVRVVSGCNAPARAVGADGSLQPATTLTVSRLPNNPRTGGQSTVQTITVTPPQTPGQTGIVAAATTGIDLLSQTVQGQVPSCVAPGGSGSSPAGTPLVGGGETTIKLGSQ